MPESTSEVIQDVTARLDRCLERLEGIKNALTGLVPLCESLEENYYMEIAIAYLENIRNMCDYEKILLANTLAEEDAEARARLCRQGLTRLPARAMDIEEIYTRIMTIYRGEMNIGLRSLIEDVLEVIKAMIKSFEICEKGLETLSAA